MYHFNQIAPATNLAYAIRFLTALPGTRAFPVAPLAKSPLWNGWQSTATSCPKQLAIDLSSPDYNVGLIPGERWAVLDIEGPLKRPGGEVEGESSYAALVDKLGPLVPTIEVGTPSGGRHLWMAVPEGVILTSQKKLLGYADIELRTGGQFCLIPPSRVRSSDGEVRDYVVSSDLGVVR